MSDIVFYFDQTALLSVYCEVHNFLLSLYYFTEMKYLNELLEMKSQESEIPKVVPGKPLLLTRLSESSLI